MAEEICILPMDAHCLDAVELLERRCFTAPWSREMLAQEMLAAGCVFLTARAGGEVSGYVSMRCVLDEGYINNVAVSPEFRRRGVARLLLQALLQAAAKRGLRMLTLEVRASNAAAIALYAGFGFVEVGVRRGYYSFPQEDALLMTLEPVSPGAQDKAQK